MAEEKTKLYELVDKIYKNEILLPDFQRGFVWKEEEMQKKLVASVLAKMPIGSILLLKAKADEYGFKMPGRKNKLDNGIVEKQLIQVLLDGQQRLTVLTNVFSNAIFKDLDNYKDLVSSKLQCRFFLKIPRYQTLKNQPEKEDIFGIKTLEYKLSHGEKGIPTFLTGDIYEYIEVQYFRKTDDKPYSPKNNRRNLLVEYCTRGEEYFYIPLFTLVRIDGDAEGYERCLERILGEIVHKTAQDIEEDYEEAKSRDDKEQIKAFEGLLHQDSWEDLKSGKDTFVRLLEEQGTTSWKKRMSEYLDSCVNELDLHQIVVEMSERDRAIDIYENLNLGGVTLSTFDLVLAKAAGHETFTEENLYDKIVDYIITSKEYEPHVIPDRMGSVYKEFRKQTEDYSASKSLGCYREDKNEIAQKYVDAFLDVLSLCCNNADYKAEKIQLDYIKRSTILKLKPEQIYKYYETACKGIDRACFFLQARCGIRNITEVRYNLMLVLLGYLFSNDAFFMDADLCKKIEAWYWSAIFAGKYDKDQNSMMKEDLKCFLHSIAEDERESYDWIRKMEADIFANKNFSDEAFLLMEYTERVPKDVVRKSICQFFLSEPYCDLLQGGNELHAFMEDADKLQEHHVIPVGSHEDSYVDGLKNIRKNKSHIVNSPLNFAYVTPKVNKQISTRSIGDYLKYCREDSLKALCLEVVDSVETEDMVKEVLRKRFGKIKEKVTERVDALLK